MAQLKLHIYIYTHPKWNFEGKLHPDSIFDYLNGFSPWNTCTHVCLYTHKYKLTCKGDQGWTLRGQVCCVVCHSLLSKVKIYGWLFLSILWALSGYELTRKKPMCLFWMGCLLCITLPHQLYCLLPSHSG